QKCMIGRVKLDKVDTPPLTVMRLQLRGFGIGKPRKILRFSGGDEAAKTVQFLADRIRKILGKLHQQRIAPPGIASGERRRLVRYLVGHAASFFSSGSLRIRCSLAGFIAQAPAYARQNRGKST